MTMSKHMLNMKQLIKAPCAYGMQRFSLTIMGTDWVAFSEGSDVDGIGASPYDALIAANKALRLHLMEQRYRLEGLDYSNGYVDTSDLMTEAELEMLDKSFTGVLDG